MLKLQFQTLTHTTTLIILLITSYWVGCFCKQRHLSGDPIQVGFFNAINSNLGIDSGIVLSTGDIIDLDPSFWLGIFL